MAGKARACSMPRPAQPAPCLPDLAVEEAQQLKELAQNILRHRRHFLQARAVLADDLNKPAGGHRVSRRAKVRVCGGSLCPPRRLHQQGAHGRKFRVPRLQLVLGVPLLRAVGLALLETCHNVLALARHLGLEKKKSSARG